MSSIEDRLDELAKRIDVLGTRFDKFEDKAEGKFFSHGLGIRLLEDTVEILERYMHRWNDVYRHVFPKRAEQDFEFERQLHRLKCPPKSEDENTKP